MLCRVDRSEATESSVRDEFVPTAWSKGVMSSKPVVHLELHTGDLRRAHALYAELCGWKTERIDTDHGSYLALELSKEMGGGIVECATHRPIWLPYVEVEDVGASTAQAQRLGASVVLSPREGPAGWRSVVSSPTGGEIAFWQQKR
jgi:predicted enzyme related to lactoylglutathione lyase